MDTLVTLVSTHRYSGAFKKPVGDTVLNYVGRGLHSMVVPHKTDPRLVRKYHRSLYNDGRVDFYYEYIEIVYKNKIHLHPQYGKHFPKVYEHKKIIDSNNKVLNIVTLERLHTLDKLNYNEIHKLFVELFIDGNTIYENAVNSNMDKTKMLIHMSEALSQSITSGDLSNLCDNIASAFKIIRDIFKYHGFIYYDIVTHNLMID